MARSDTKKVTIQDVATAAGVSLATVSLVLGDKGKLRPETRERVRKAIAATGYQVRGASRAKTGDKPSQYALIVDDLANPYFHRLYKGLDKGLAAEGALVTMLSSEDAVDRQSALLRKLSDAGIDGFVVVPASGTAPADLGFLPKDKRLILAVRNIAQGTFNYVGANPFVGMMLAIDHLASLGHRSIAFIGGHQSNYAYGERYAGLAASLMKAGIPLSNDRIVSGESNRVFGRDAALQLLQATEPPTAMIGYNDLVALGIMDGITAAGLVPGKDIAVIGYDDIPEAAQQSVPLTTVATPADRLGEVIATALTNGASQRTAPPVDITYPPRLVIRSSCGARQTDAKKLAS